MSKEESLKQILSLIDEVDLIERNFCFYHKEGIKINEEMEAIIFSKQDLFQEGQDKLDALKKKFEELVVRYNKDCKVVNRTIEKLNKYLEKTNNPMKIKGLEDFYNFLD